MADDNLIETIEGKTQDGRSLVVERYKTIDPHTQQATWYGTLNGKPATMDACQDAINSMRGDVHHILAHLSC